MTRPARGLPGLNDEQRAALRTRLRQARSAATWTRGEAGLPGVPRLSLYFFPSDTVGPAEYFPMVLEACVRADAAGFNAVWIPERHFVSFGGQHPNPAILAAAIAVRTNRIQIRAGSVAAPLHHPVRIAEEWAVVDNLSGGRVGISFASGWHPDDFVLARTPYEERRATTLRTVAEVRALWAGKAVEFADCDGTVLSVRVTPAPVQPELPIWLTAAGSPSTFEAAAKAGCGVMTALLGQTLPELRANIARYRAAWRDSGRSGQGDVVVMVHAFVSDDPGLEDILRPVMHAYLAAYRRQTATSAGDERELLEAAFRGYLDGPSLLGTRAKAAGVLAELVEAGADEVGCLVDFGLPPAVLLEGLAGLAELGKAVAAP